MAEERSIPFRSAGGGAEVQMKELSAEIFSLTPSSIITLYEIDITDIQSNLNLGSAPIEESVLRFHNMEVLNRSTLKFKSKEYHPIPIITDGFELRSDGGLPRPTLTFASLKATEDLQSNNQFASLKRAILELNNMIGAKVTRIRTFAKFLDADNPGISIETAEFSSNKNPELPRDIFYVERKVSEDKSGIQLELASVLDIENFKLPARLCLATKCSWSYRGEGCCYEYQSAGSAETHGATGHLPNSAPAIADDQDNLISETVTGYSTSTTPTEYNFSKANSPTYAYVAGDVVFITKNDIRYYYVAKTNVPSQTGPPPNTNYWIADTCSKTINGCKLRWGNNGAAKKSDGTAANKFLPFGGFPGTNTKTTIQ